MYILKDVKVHTAKDGKIIEKANIVIKGKKIEDIVEKELKSISKDYKVLDLKGKIVMPGFIDAHTHIGICEGYSENAGDDGNDFASASTPSLRAIDAINPENEIFKLAREIGITSVSVMHGSAKPFNGITCTFKTYGTVIDEMIYDENIEGLKMAFGENPKRCFAQKGVFSTRAGFLGYLRKTLLDAKNYIEEKNKSEKEKKPFKIDLDKEILQKLLERKMKARIHVHRKDDIASVMRVAKEFNILYSLEHATEGYKIIEKIKEENLIVVFGPPASCSNKIELKDSNFIKNCLDFEKNGIDFCVSTDYPAYPQDFIITPLSVAIANGLKEETALKALTINPAKLLGIDKRVGTIEKKKDADLLVFDKSPFIYNGARLESLFINGEVVK